MFEVPPINTGELTVGGVIFQLYRLRSLPYLQCDFKAFMVRNLVIIALIKYRSRDL